MATPTASNPHGYHNPQSNSEIPPSSKTYRRTKWVKLPLAQTTSRPVSHNRSNEGRRQKQIRAKRIEHRHVFTPPFVQQQAPPPLLAIRSNVLLRPDETSIIPHHWDYRNNVSLSQRELTQDQQARFNHFLESKIRIAGRTISVREHIASLQERLKHTEGIILYDICVAGGIAQEIISEKTGKLNAPSDSLDFNDIDLKFFIKVRDNSRFDILRNLVINEYYESQPSDTEKPLSWDEIRQKYLVKQKRVVQEDQLVIDPSGGIRSNDKWALHAMSEEGDLRKEYIWIDTQGRGWAFTEDSFCISMCNYSQTGAPIAVALCGNFEVAYQDLQHHSLRTSRPEEIRYGLLKFVDVLIKQRAPVDPQLQSQLLNKFISDVPQGDLTTTIKSYLDSHFKNPIGKLLYIIQLLTIFQGHPSSSIASPLILDALPQEISSPPLFSNLLRLLREHPTEWETTLASFQFVCCRLNIFPQDFQHLLPEGLLSSSANRFLPYLLTVVLSIENQKNGTLLLPMDLLLVYRTFLVKCFTRQNRPFDSRYSANLLSFFEIATPSLFPSPKNGVEGEAPMSTPTSLFKKMTECLEADLQIILSSSSGKTLYHYSLLRDLYHQILYFMPVLSQEMNIPNQLRELNAQIRSCFTDADILAFNKTDLYFFPHQGISPDLFDRITQPFSLYMIGSLCEQITHQTPKSEIAQFLHQRLKNSRQLNLGICNFFFLGLEYPEEHYVAFQRELEGIVQRLPAFDERSYELIGTKLLWILKFMGSEIRLHRHLLYLLPACFSIIDSSSDRNGHIKNTMQFLDSFSSEDREPLSAVINRLNEWRSQNDSFDLPTAYKQYILALAESGNIELMSIAIDKYHEALRLLSPNQIHDDLDFMTHFLSACFKCKTNDQAAEIWQNMQTSSENRVELLSRMIGTLANSADHFVQALDLVENRRNKALLNSSPEQHQQCLHRICESALNHLKDDNFKNNLFPSIRERVLRHAVSAIKFQSTRNQAEPVPGKAFSYKLLELFLEINDAAHAQALLVQMDATEQWNGNEREEIHVRALEKFVSHCAIDGMRFSLKHLEEWAKSDNRAQFFTPVESACNQAIRENSEEALKQAQLTLNALLNTEFASSHRDALERLFIALLDQLFDSVQVERHTRACQILLEGNISRFLTPKVYRSYVKSILKSVQNHLPQNPSKEQVDFATESLRLLAMVGESDASYNDGQDLPLIQGIVIKALIRSQHPSLMRQAWDYFNHLDERSLAPAESAMIYSCMYQTMVARQRVGLGNSTVSFEDIFYGLCRYSIFTQAHPVQVWREAIEDHVLAHDREKIAIIQTLGMTKVPLISDDITEQIKLALRLILDETNHQIQIYEPVLHQLLANLLERKDPLFTKVASRFYRKATHHGFFRDSARFSDLTSEIIITLTSSGSAADLKRGLSIYRDALGTNSLSSTQNYRCLSVLFHIALRQLTDPLNRPNVSSRLIQEIVDLGIALQERFTATDENKEKFPVDIDRSSLAPALENLLSLLAYYPEHLDRARDLLLTIEEQHLWPIGNDLRRRESIHIRITQHLSASDHKGCIQFMEKMLSWKCWEHFEKRDVLFEMAVQEMKLDCSVDILVATGRMFNQLLNSSYVQRSREAVQTALEALLVQLLVHDELTCRTVLFIILLNIHSKELFEEIVFLSYLETSLCNLRDLLAKNPTEDTTEFFTECLKLFHSCKGVIDDPAFISLHAELYESVLDILLISKNDTHTQQAWSILEQMPKNALDPAKRGDLFARMVSSFAASKNPKLVELSGEIFINHISAKDLLAHDPVTLVKTMTTVITRLGAVKSSLLYQFSGVKELKSLQALQVSESDQFAVMNALAQAIASMSTPTKKFPVNRDLLLRELPALSEAFSTPLVALSNPISKFSLYLQLLQVIVDLKEETLLKAAYKLFFTIKSQNSFEQTPIQVAEGYAMLIRGFASLKGKTALFSKHLLMTATNETIFDQYPLMEAQATRNVLNCMASSEDLSHLQSAADLLHRAYEKKLLQDPETTEFAHQIVASIPQSLPVPQLQTVFTQIIRPLHGYLASSPQTFSPLYLPLFMAAFQTKHSDTFDAALSFLGEIHELFSAEPNIELNLLRQLVKGAIAILDPNLLEKTGQLIKQNIDRQRSKNDGNKLSKSEASQLRRSLQICVINYLDSALHCDKDTTVSVAAGILTVGFEHQLFKFNDPKIIQLFQVAIERLCQFKDRTMLDQAITLLSYAQKRIFPSNPQIRHETSQTLTEKCLAAALADKNNQYLERLVQTFAEDRSLYTREMVAMIYFNFIGSAIATAHNTLNMPLAIFGVNTYRTAVKLRIFESYPSKAIHLENQIATSITKSISAEDVTDDNAEIVEWIVNLGHKMADTQVPAVRRESPMKKVLKRAPTLLEMLKDEF